MKVYCIGTGAAVAPHKKATSFYNIVRESRPVISCTSYMKKDKCVDVYAAKIKDSSSLNGKLYEISEAAMSEAVGQAGLSTEELRSNKRIGFVYGTSLADMMMYEAYVKEADALQLNGFAADISYRLRKHFRLHGPGYTITNACATGVSAVEIADRLIQDNIVDTCIVGCADIVSDFILAGMDRLKILNKSGKMQPFSAKSEGLILGDGAGFVVLSSSKTKNTACCIAGYSVTNDAIHISTPDICAVQLNRAIHESLLMAGITAADIDVVACSGNGIEANDLMQANAIKNMGLSESAKVVSVKPLIGHTLAASGLLELIAAAYMMKDGFIIPYCNDYQKAFEFLEIPFSKKSEMRQINHVLLIVTGFGGINGSVVLSEK